MIVEGEKDEPRIIGKEECGFGLLPFMGVSDYEIVALGNPIYELYDKVRRGECDDIVAYLCAKGKLKLPEGMLSKTAFSAIYLIFDFEPHYQKYSDEAIREMLAFFNNETEMGKLYINYPMLEACQHIKALPDPDFDERKIALTEDFGGNKYKKLVKKETCLSLKRIPRDEIGYMLMHSYNKAKKLDGDADLMPNYHGILERQIDEKNHRGEIFVLGTLPLMAIDYNLDLTLSTYDLRWTG